MPLLSLVLGGVLLALGVVGYVITDMVSWTALIPAFFGLPLGLLGLGARRRAGWRRPAMHAAAGLALLGLLGSVMGIPKVIELLAGGAVQRPGAAIAQAIMAVLCLVYLVLATLWFVDARRRRKEAAQPSA